MKIFIFSTNSIFHIEIKFLRIIQTSSRELIVIHIAPTQNGQCPIPQKDGIINLIFYSTSDYQQRLCFNCYYSYGEIHPQNWKERLTALICMIVECTKLSVILGNLAALLTNNEIKVGAFKYHLKVVQEHMVNYTVLYTESVIFTQWLFQLNMTLPDNLRKRVVDRYEYMVRQFKVKALLLIKAYCCKQWKQSNGEEIEKLLLMLPPNLQTALFTETHQEMLDAVS